MSVTATELRQNLRVMRAQPLLHLILDAIKPHLRQDEEGSSYERAEQLALPPRGPDGWTTEEMIALEKRRLELLSNPIWAISPALDVAALKEQKQ